MLPLGCCRLAVDVATDLLPVACSHNSLPVRYTLVRVGFGQVESGGLHSIREFIAIINSEDETETKRAK